MRAVGGRMNGLGWVGLGWGGDGMGVERSDGAGGWSSWDG